VWCEASRRRKTVERDIGSTTGQYGSTGGATEQAKQQGQQLASQARQQASELATRGGEQIKSQLANQKHEASQRMLPVQAALRETAQQLRKQGQGSTASYTDSAADRVERISGYLRETDVDEIADEVRGFARSRPAVFLSGAAALGFLVTRFLKSSSQGQQGQGSAGYGYEGVPNATSRASVAHGTAATALPPGPVEGIPPTSVRVTTPEPTPSVEYGRGDAR
jgi:beta-phosphoglucomutase-like phosphatase (HAD superfamily)